MLPHGCGQYIFYRNGKFASDRSGVIEGFSLNGERGVAYFYKNPPKRCKMLQKNDGLKIRYSVSFRF